MLPIEADYRINFEKLSHQLDRLIEMKVHGIYSNGTAAEFFTQAEEEFDRVNRENQLSAISYPVLRIRTPKPKTETQ